MVAVACFFPGRARDLPAPGKLTYNLHYRSVIYKNSTVYLSALINRLKPSDKYVYFLIDLPYKAVHASYTL